MKHVVAQATMLTILPIACVLATTSNDGIIESDMCGVMDGETVLVSWVLLDADLVLETVDESKSAIFCPSVSTS